MYRKERERYAIGVFVSSMIGSLTYMLSTNWIYLALALVSGLFFLMKLLLVRKG